MNDLEEYLDIQFEPIIIKAKKRFSRSLHPDIFAAKVTGFLLHTAIKLAQKHKCPRLALESSITIVIQRYYES